MARFIVQEDGYCGELKQNPEHFWPKYLNKKRLNWGKNILRLIQIILVLPANGADAERSLSIMNHIKYGRRSRITSKNLNNWMRIRINGPKEIDKDKENDKMLKQQMIKKTIRKQEKFL